MKGTTFSIEEHYNQLLMSRSGEERLKMGCSMHETAKKWDGPLYYTPTLMPQRTPCDRGCSFDFKPMILPPKPKEKSFRLSLDIPPHK